VMGALTAILLSAQLALAKTTGKPLIVLFTPVRMAFAAACFWSCHF
jgi:G:T-mismatch repair DNA endonuclease (very short patch repair protein)